MSRRVARIVVLGLLVVMGFQMVLSTTLALAASAGDAKTGGKREPTIRLKLVGTSTSPLYTDGVSWAVYEPAVGVTRIMNTVKGYAVNRPDPLGCTGGLLAIGGGEILYACSDPECPEALDACRIKPLENYETGRWVVEDITSGAQHPVAFGEGLPVSPSQFGGLSDLNAIGSQWAVGSVNTQFGGARFFLNWHTGRVIEEHRGEPESANRDYESLNSETLLMSLCRPLTRGIAPTQERLALPRYFPSQYAPPFMIQERFKLGEVRGRAYLKRCGSTREELIPELEGVGSGVQLGSGVLSDYRRLWRLNARRRSWLGRSYRLIGQPQPHEAGEAYAGHTSTMVFETIEPTPAPETTFREGAPVGHGPERYEVWVGKLPWR
jgi:hypothetical protein